MFPGQGAQYVGMGRDFFDSFACAREIFEEADDILKQKLSALIFNGTENELALTQNSQLSIYIVSAAILKVIQQEVTGTPLLCLGLSLGEYSALLAANYFTFSEGLQLVQKRGEGMHHSCIKNPGGMAAVLGLDSSIVEQIVAELTQDEVWSANFNSPGQVVIAGSLEGIEIATNALKAKGAKRVIPLQVEGAFHTPYMEEAKQSLALEIAKVNWQNPTNSVVMNVSGTFAKDLEAVKQNLILQVVSPVRWEKSIMEASNHCEIFVEIGCGKTLTGLNKKISANMGKILETYSIEKVEDLKNLCQIF